ncbi:MAG: hypothetical protein ACE5EO_04770 [Candidatus Krumholzibacteriia bacterium]
MRRNLLYNGSLAVLALLVALALAEGALRVAYGDKFGRRPGFIIGHQVLGWEPAPNLDHTFYGSDFAMEIRTDAEGHRLGALGEVAADDELIILCGDSNVFGWGVGTTETCASDLDERVHGASGGRVRVVNLGVPGYGTLQSHLRLAEFLADHASARIAAVFIVHAPNDPIDNVNSIGYHIGAWKVVDRQLKARSRSHLVNFAAYSWSIIKLKINPPRHETSDTGAIVHPYLRDIDFAFDTVLPKTLPRSVTMNGRPVALDSISAEDYSKTRTFKRRTLTRTQRDLMREGVTSFHRLLAGRGLKLFHIILPTAADWYAGEVMGLLEQTEPSAGNDVEVLGKYPDISRYPKPYMNAHSGRHYTPEFNRYWAKALMDVLVGENVVTPVQP